MLYLLLKQNNSCFMSQKNYILTLYIKKTCLEISLETGEIPN